MVYYLNGVTISTADTQRCIKSMKILKKTQWFIIWMALPFPLPRHGTSLRGSPSDRLFCDVFNALQMQFKLNHSPPSNRKALIIRINFQSYVNCSSFLVYLESNPMHVIEYVYIKHLYVCDRICNFYVCIKYLMRYICMYVIVY